MSRSYRPSTTVSVTGKNRLGADELQPGFDWSDPANTDLIDAPDYLTRGGCYALDTASTTFGTTVVVRPGWIYRELRA